MPRYDVDDRPRKRPPLFWWLLANILAIAFAISSWVVCLNLFRDPTNPTSYKLMLKVGRLDPPMAYTATNAPDSQQDSTPEELLTQFESYTKSDREALNSELKRAYLTNFTKPKYHTYVTGEFRIIGIKSLTENDFLSPGLVVKAQALVRPDAVSDPLPYPVFIECLFPSKDTTFESFSVGNTLMLEKQRDRAAILNVATTDFEDRPSVFVTLVSLAAVKHITASGATFQITPPAMANPEATLPSYP